MKPVLSGNWNYPTQVWHGPGAVARLAEACQRAGIARPLLVTDSHLQESGHFIRTTQLLELASMAPVVFSSFAGTPALAQIDAEAAAFREAGCDGVVALGGGSALDAGKCIALAARRGRPLLAAVAEAAGGSAPTVVIPTTAGTGSEASATAMLADGADGGEAILSHAALMPAIVLADPELCVSMPAPLTAWTGLAALSHAVEAYCAPGFHPLADGVAVEAVRLIADHLPTAIRDGADLEARSRMLAASTMSAAAAQKGLGPVQALAGPLRSAMAGRSHYGLISGVLLPYALMLRRAEAEERLAYLAVVLGLPGADFDALLDWLLALRAGLGMPHSLAELGVSETQAEAVCHTASRRRSHSPQLGADDLSRLLTAAIRGDLALAA
jgi:hypothetical protein